MKKNTVPLTQENFDCLMLAVEGLSSRIRAIELDLAANKSKQEKPCNWQEQWYY